MRNELFVNTINNFVFLRKPFITWKPPLVTDAPGSLVRRGHQSRPRPGGSGLSRARSADTHTHSHLEAS